MTEQIFEGLDAYQHEAQKTAIYPGVGTGSPDAIAYTVLGLTGEAGELANKYKKVIRDNGGRLSAAVSDAMAAELGDVLWYVAMLARELNASLSAVAAANVNKLAARKANNTLQGSGDER